MYLLPFVLHHVLLIFILFYCWFCFSILSSTVTPEKTPLGDPHPVLPSKSWFRILGLRASESESGSLSGFLSGFLSGRSSDSSDVCGVRTGAERYLWRGLGRLSRWWLLLADPALLSLTLILPSSVFHKLHWLHLSFAVFSVHVCVLSLTEVIEWTWNQTCFLCHLCPSLALWP